MSLKPRSPRLSPALSATQIAERLLCGGVVKRIRTMLQRGLPRLALVAVGLACCCTGITAVPTTAASGSGGDAATSTLFACGSNGEVGADSKQIIDLFAVVTISTMMLGCHLCSACGLVASAPMGLVVAAERTARVSTVCASATKATAEACAKLSLTTASFPWR